MRVRNGRPPSPRVVRPEDVIQGGSCHAGGISPAGLVGYSALMRRDSLEIFREAMFFLTTPRVTPRISSGWAFLRASPAPLRSPAAIAASTFLTKVRTRALRAPFTRILRESRRARFFADVVLAIGFLSNSGCVGGKRSPVKARTCPDAVHPDVVAGVFSIMERERKKASRAAPAIRRAQSSLPCRRQALHPGILEPMVAATGYRLCRPAEVVSRALNAFPAPNPFQGRGHLPARSRAFDRPGRLLAHPGRDVPAFIPPCPSANKNAAIPASGIEPAAGTIADVARRRPGGRAASFADNAP